MTSEHQCGACGCRFGLDPRSYASVEGPRFGYSVCPRCGLQRIAELPDADTVRSAYAPVYYGEGRAKFPPLVEALRDACVVYRVWFVRSVSSLRRGRVLDIGCGDGRFLKFMSRAGWKIVGTEREGPAYERASRVPGVDLYQAAEERLPAADSSFDAVTLWHVLEHTVDPEAVLGECFRVLRPGGVLAVEVPNVASCQARWSGEHWFHLDPPRHLYQFTPQALRLLLDRAGFSPIRSTTYSLQMGAFGIVQSVLNRFLPQRDLLFASLRNRDKASKRAGLLLIMAALVPFALILSLMESAARSGAVIRIACRKPIQTL